MSVQRRISICPEGLLYVIVLGFLLAGAVTRQINLLMILFGMLAGPLLLSWRMVKVSLKRLEIERKLPRSIAAGERFNVELVLTNRRRRLGSWAVTAADSFRHDGGPADQGALESEVLFPFVAAGQTRRAVYHGRLTKRGRYRFGPLRLSTRFPLGLVRYSVSFDRPDSLLVVPRLGRLTAGWQRWLNSADMGLTRTARGQGFSTGEFYGLRDWRTGDSRRWLHWRTSARCQTPVVRQFAKEHNQALALVVELWQPEQPAPHDADHVELAVSFAATICAEMCRDADRWLGLALAGRHEWLGCGAASSTLLQAAMEQLALAQPSSSDRLPEVLAGLVDRLRPDSRVLVVSTRPCDLSDPVRFQELWTDRRRGWQGRMAAIDVGTPELDALYRPA